MSQRIFLILLLATILLKECVPSVTEKMTVSQDDHEALNRKLSEIVSDSSKDINNEAKGLWEHYKKVFGKLEYSAKEEAERFSLFTKKLLGIVDEHQKKHNLKEGVVKTLGLDKMADWTEDEIKKFKESLSEKKSH
ncbi:hypothetical protein ACOME3_003366 [Neoechinorhynchus agilis]